MSGVVLATMMRPPFLTDAAADALVLAALFVLITGLWLLVGRTAQGLAWPAIVWRAMPRALVMMIVFLLLEVGKAASSYAPPLLALLVFGIVEYLVYWRPAIIRVQGADRRNTQRSQRDQVVG